MENSGKCVQVQPELSIRNVSLINTEIIYIIGSNFLCFFFFI